MGNAQSFHLNDKYLVGSFYSSALFVAFICTVNYVLTAIISISHRVDNLMVEAVKI